MKRIITFIIAVSLTLSVLPSLGEEGGSATVRTLDLYWHNASGTQLLQEVLPGVTLDSAFIDFDENGERHVQQYLLEHPDEWDVAYISTDECSLAALCQAGLVMDMDQQDAVADVYDGMFPKVLEGVSYEGRAYGIPVDIFGCVMQMGLGEEKVLTSLGFSDTDTPQTFQEYCQLATKYMTLSKEDRKGTVFHYDGSASNYVRYMLPYYIDLYTAEFCQSDGRVVYDTDIFRQGLRDALSMCEALQADMKMTYGEDGRVHVVTQDTSNGLFYGKQNRKLYLHIGSQQVIPANLSMVVVNQNAKNLPEALEIAKLYADRDAAQFEACFKTMDDDRYAQLFHRSYDELIAAQIAQNEEPSVIDDLETRRAAGDTSWFFEKEEAAFYAEHVAPYLTFPQVPRVDSDGLVKQYQTGALDEDGLIQALQQAADAYRLRQEQQP